MALSVCCVHSVLVRSNNFFLSALLFALLLDPFLYCQAPPQSISAARDPMLLDVITRVVNASGGLQTLATVRDLTETGEITFHSGDNHSGPVTIKALGSNHFRMEADLPEGKRIWAVRGGVGSVKMADAKVRPLPYDSAQNLENLTFPLAFLSAALNDAKTDLSLLGIENQDGRSIYRIRMHGQLGLGGLKTGPDLPVIKDLLVDALSFSILRVEDRPFRTPSYEQKSKSLDKPSREVQFGDFRRVNGLLVPFSISTKLLGQKILTIQLSSVSFNSNLRDDDFDN